MAPGRPPQPRPTPHFRAVKLAHTPRCGLLQNPHGGTALRLLPGAARPSHLDRSRPDHPGMAAIPQTRLTTPFSFLGPSAAEIYAPMKGNEVVIEGRRRRNEAMRSALVPGERPPRQRPWNGAWTGRIRLARVRTPTFPYAAARHSSVSPTVGTDQVQPRTVPQT